MQQRPISGTCEEESMARRPPQVEGPCYEAESHVQAGEFSETIWVSSRKQRPSSGCTFRLAQPKDGDAESFNHCFFRGTKLRYGEEQYVACSA